MWKHYRGVPYKNISVDRYFLLAETGDKFEHLR